MLDRHCTRCAAALSMAALELPNALGVGPRRVNNWRTMTVLAHSLKTWEQITKLTEIEAQ